MSGWFGFGKSVPAVGKEKITARALPAQWYTSPAMYELERRAIFSKKWIMISHKLRFVNAGDYIQVTEAGFPFFLVRDRQGNINAFHNVCRHRAYPIVEGGAGKASILACKYHGWSYGFNGKLAKAPKYQDMDGFSREANSLFPIHVHVDKLGFIWVNLEAKSQPTVSWEEDLGGVDHQSRLAGFDMTAYHFDHSWEMIGDYNWKTLADNYNECYHCTTGHPAVNAVTDLSAYRVETKSGHIQHFSADKPDVKGLGIFSTYLYPNSSQTIGPHFFYIQRVIPISAHQTKMEYEVYRQNSATDGDFTYISEFFKQVLREDKDLCNAAQKNLEVGIFRNGELHPHNEKGPLYFQNVTKSLVVDHRQKEEANGTELWPAAPQHVVLAKDEEEVEFCAKLDCMAGKQSQALEW